MCPRAPPFASLRAFPWLVDFVPPAVPEGVARWLSWDPSFLGLRSQRSPGGLGLHGSPVIGWPSPGPPATVWGTDWWKALHCPAGLLKPSSRSPPRAASPRPPPSILCSNLPSTFASLPATDHVLPRATGQSPPTARPHTVSPLGTTRSDGSPPLARCSLPCCPHRSPGCETSDRPACHLACLWCNHVALFSLGAGPTSPVPTESWLALPGKRRFFEDRDFVLLAVTLVGVPDLCLPDLLLSGRTLWAWPAAGTVGGPWDLCWWWLGPWQQGCPVLAPPPP